MARNSKKKKEEVIEELPHLTPEEKADIDVRTAKVNIRILEAKALQLELQNREKIIMLDAKAGQLTYIATALSEFSNGMGSFVSELRQMPDHLQAACKWSGICRSSETKEPIPFENSDSAVAIYVS